jgi:hypothetical protein
MYLGDFRVGILRVRNNELVDETLHNGLGHYVPQQRLGHDTQAEGSKPSPSSLEDLRESFEKGTLKV